mmetsp:Transcript_47979/g.117684  ORF Transcript_47979/g.117684 Transcript_47979/m.117684 type:complete len:324 (-) Transcript_47979:1178-2149(-)
MSRGAGVSVWKLVGRAGGPWTSSCRSRATFSIARVFQSECGADGGVPVCPCNVVWRWRARNLPRGACGFGVRGMPGRIHVGWNEVLGVCWRDWRVDSQFCGVECCSVVCVLLVELARDCEGLGDAGDHLCDGDDGADVAEPGDCRIYSSGLAVGAVYDLRCYESLALGSGFVGLLVCCWICSISVCEQRIVLPGGCGDDRGTRCGVPGSAAAAERMEVAAGEDLEHDRPVLSGWFHHHEQRGSGPVHVLFTSDGGEQCPEVQRGDLRGERPCDHGDGWSAGRGAGPHLLGCRHDARVDCAKPGRQWARSVPSVVSVFSLSFSH